MSGEKELKELAVQDRWNEFEKTTSDYIDSLVPSVPSNLKETIEKSLNLTRDEIKSFDTNTCLEHAYNLDRYAIFIQSETNKHNAKLAWAEHNLDITVGSCLSSQTWGTQYTKYEEKRLMIVADNEFCKSLNKMIITSKSIVKNLYGISGKINTIAKTLKDIAYSKRYSYD